MIQTSAEYKNAIVAPTRRIVPKAVIDLTDPDFVATNITGDIVSTYSFPDQLVDKDTDYSGLIYATLEPNRWLLDGTQNIMPDTPSSRTGEQGVIGDTLGDSDAAMTGSIEVSMSGVDTLQIVTVAATGVDVDGLPVSVTLDIYSGDTLLYSTTEDMDGRIHEFAGFTVTQPNKLVLTVNSWTLPGRRFRFVEFLPGVLETWVGNTIYRMDVIQKSDLSNLTMPYASASLEIDNTNKRFDPSNENSIFLSVTARQPVTLFYGVEIEGSVEYVPVGIYYQRNEGWTIENDGLTIRWDLIDIIGLLVDRKYETTSKPTNLAGWISSIVGNLDASFSGHYTIDNTLGNPSLTCQDADIENITCGDLLRYVCQAVNAYAVSDPVTGYLHIKALDNTSQSIINLRQQNSIPGSRANTDIAFLSFDIGGVQYNIPGTEEISDQTVNIKNPFITTTMAAVSAAQLILTQYGGNVLNLQCRGDMSREIGDVETVEVYPNQTVAARIFEQQLTLDNGIMTNVPLRMLQANGGKLYTDVIVITEDGTYNTPAGITEITLVLIGGGQGGEGGEGGTLYYFRPAKDNGVGGTGGKGGRVYSTPLTINDGQQFTVSIGRGGAGGKGGSYNYHPQIYDRHGDPGADGTATTVTMGTVFTSANGVYMNTGYVDLLTNAAYGVPGADGMTGASNPQIPPVPTAFSGNGGGGGDGGRQAIDEMVKDPDAGWGPDYERAEIISPPKNGANGQRGADGCVLIFYAR